jgi:tRNA uridine 5-carboxymethylaminomethyl modification enzyme
VTAADVDSALADSLYSGYLKAQEVNRGRLERHDSLRVPQDLAFGSLSGLSHEMVERLERARPRTFGEAKRIPGLTAAALSTLLVSISAAAGAKSGG